MHDEVYTDGIGEITVSGTIVRVDLVSLSPSERDAGGKPKAVFRQRLVFPIDGFANSVEVMQKALQGLVESGAVQRTKVSANNDSSSGIRLPMDNASPNFRQT